MSLSRHPHTDPSRPYAVALIDARYLRWLARLDDAEGVFLAALSRSSLNEPLHHALQRTGARAALLRTYWYTDTDDHAVYDDQTLRTLPAQDSDGAALVRQMAADLQALVASGRVDVVVIASDDDRLLAPIDAAKLAGVSVYLLADERAQVMPRLMQQDPNWARLLREADRRLILRADELAQALQPSGERTAPVQAAALREQDLQAVIGDWWQEQSDDDRESLRNELPALRGLPPEVDRELLLRGKNALNRSLNFHEKRWMREHARQTALGQGQAGGDASAAAAAAASE
jgi:hypothetical protein